jgi:DNA-directed RNA polymerase subunit RPC12/RpoP
MAQDRPPPPPSPPSGGPPPPPPEEPERQGPWGAADSADTEAVYEAQDAAAEGGDPTQFPCENCGALLKFKPGTDAIACEYCGHENLIAEADHTIEEIPFEEALSAESQTQETHEVQTVKCGSCAAEFTLEEGVTSDECPFCGSQIVLEPTTHTLLKPKSLLPFKVDQQEARQHFRKWVASRWFAPNKFKDYARAQDGFTGMYVPYWTYDSQTESDYKGMRGKYYYVTRTTYVNGKPQVRTERRIRWTPAAGRVARFFDDVLILADTKLPRKYTERLEPWDLDNLTPYDQRYLAGFRSETYGVDVREGFEDAKQVMDRTIRADVRADIGGDVQRITWLRTVHSGVTYKHVLLPVWLAAYRYQQKPYNIVINGRTGEVQGERPWSWVKIAAAVLGALAAVLIALLIYDYVAETGWIFSSAAEPPSIGSPAPSTAGAGAPLDELMSGGGPSPPASTGK